VSGEDVLGAAVRELCNELFAPTTASRYRRVVELRGDLDLETRGERRRLAQALTAPATFRAAEPEAAR
jgi:hypothetical protein